MSGMQVALIRGINVGAAKLRVSASMIVLSAAEVAAAVAGNSLRDLATNPSRLLVTVLGKSADRARLAPLLRETWAPEALAVGARVAYQWCPEGILASPVAKAVNKVLGEHSTARNWSTFLKLHELARKPD